MTAQALLHTAYWARRHPNPARSALVLLMLILSSLSLLLGFSLGEGHWQGSNGFGEALWVGAIGYLIWRYPKGSAYSSFWKRFRFNAGIYGLAFLAMSWLGSHPCLHTAPSKQADFQPLALYTFSLIPNAPYKAKASELNRQEQRKAKRQERKAMRKKVRGILKKMRAEGRGIRSWSKGYQVLFFVGAAVGAFILFVILLVLSCSLICAGSYITGLAFFALSIASGVASLVLMAMGVLTLIRPKDYYRRKGRSGTYREEIDG